MQRRQPNRKSSRSQPKNAVKIEISPADHLNCEPEVKPGSASAETPETISSSQQSVRLHSESRSKLDRTLWELLSDSMSLPYFIQFMEHDGDMTLVQFWLAAESFRVTTEERLRAHRESARTVGSQRQPISHRTDINRHPLFANGDTLDTSHLKLRSRGSRMGNVDDQRELLGLSKVALAPTDRLGQERKISARRKGAIMTSSGLNDQSSRQLGFMEMEGSMVRQQSKSAESDAMGLYETYISLLAENPLPLDEQTRLQVERNICRDDGIIRPDSFQVAQDFVFQLMEQKYYPEFLKSQYMCRYQIEVMTSGKLNLHDILFHNITMGYFMQFLEQEGDVRSLEFWLTADSVQEQLLDQTRRGTYVEDAAVADCMVLYSRYFSLQATHPLNFRDHIRIDLEVNICREGGPLPSCFNAAQKIAFEQMEAHFFSFLRSELYYQHLSELLGAIRSDRSNTPRSSISEGSTGPSEIMSPEDKVRTSFRTRLGVDCGENPDLLWRRHSKGLVLGRINEQGIYESDIEEQLKRISKHGHRGMRQRLSHAMRKLVGNDDTEKEEMARKIAHMIVNSISQQVEQGEQTERTRDARSVASSSDSSSKT